MKVLVIGATGFIGREAVKELEIDAEIITASRSSSDYEVDIASPDSIKKLFEDVGKVDAVVCAAGGAKFKNVTEMTLEENQVAVDSKLLGQVNLVLLGQHYVNDGGSFTLITGVLMDDPLPKAASAAMANGGVRAFVKTAAIELPRGIRINNVSPTMIVEAKEKYGPLFQGFKPRDGNDVGLAYRKSVFGRQTGQTYEVY
ncbi:short chain dehydrogenase [Salinicoccus sp. YB14-2]|uniref:short chain dehydrogenase n=1 Tax=Salinicoccus sp. YB14-2 TaxID=1572701 RepID=UPI000691B623|nr:short chain dehydrogenase [Salinicoccus sp. YB14-2]